MPIQLIPAVNPPTATPKTANQGGSLVKPVLAGKRFTVSKPSPGKSQAGLARRDPNAKTRVPKGPMVVPTLPPVPGMTTPTSAPLKSPASQKQLPQQREPLTTAIGPGADPLGQRPGSTPLPELNPLGRAGTPSVEPPNPKTEIINSRRSPHPRTSKIPGKSIVTLKPGRGPAPSVRNLTLASNPPTVVIPGTAPAATVHSESLSASKAIPSTTMEVGAKLPSPPRGWRIQPTTVRRQVGAMATRWKVSPPGRIRHAMEITIANSGSNWQVEVKAHHQDGAWLSGALANTTALTQGFSQHGWDLSQVSLWLGQPNSGGNPGQYFGQSGHAPPESHHGGYGSSGTRSESRSMVGPQTGINYTA